MNVLDLFSGIGGFSLGLERSGMRTKAFCEIDPYCRRVLARHWPDVPVWGDIRTLTVEWVMANAAPQRVQRQRWIKSDTGDRRRHVEPVRQIDVICGGFPCQDISTAGKGAGITGERSGLWKEYARLIGEVRPRYAIIENVSALLHRGLSDVLGDLSALGYDAEWHCIPASAVGAPHRRDRIWIVANARCVGRPATEPEDPRSDRATRSKRREQANGVAGCCDVADVNAGRQLQSQGCLGEIGRWLGDSGWWLTEPDVGRVAHGVPARVHRLRALGNAVVPQIPELIGRAILAHEGQDNLS